MTNYTKAEFDCDGIYGTMVGYYNAEAPLWNGRDCPLFDFKTTIDLLESGGIDYIVDGDKITYEGDEGDPYQLHSVEIDDVNHYMIEGWCFVNVERYSS